MPSTTSQRAEQVFNDRTKEGLVEHETLTLTARDWEAFLAGLDNAHRPRPRLAAAARRYRSRRERDVR